MAANIEEDLLILREKLVHIHVKDKTLSGEMLSCRIRNGKFW